MARKEANALEEQPIYTLAELARALKMRRRTGHPDTHRVRRHLRRLGIPVLAGKPGTVHAADVLDRAPKLYVLLLGGRPDDA